jgi:hypothetical protein
MTTEKTTEMTTEKTMEKTTEMTATDLQSRIERFMQWFRELEAQDQVELMKLVYNEHRIRDVVRSFSGMSVEQRQSVFQRLGLPNDLLSRIPPPAVSQLGDVEVEWKEWDGSEER